MMIGEFWIDRSRSPYLKAKIAAVFPRPVEIFSTFLTITQGAEPEELRRGPYISFEVTRPVPTGEIELKAAMGGSICVMLDPFGTCIGMEVSAAFGVSDNGFSFKGFTIKGIFPDEIYPLAPILPEFIKDTIVIHTIQLSFTVLPQNPTELQFKLGATLGYRPPDLFNLGLEFGLGLYAEGILFTDGSLPCGMFRTTSMLPTIDMGDINLPGLYIILVSECSRRRRMLAVEAHKPANATQGFNLAEAWNAWAPSGRPVRHLQAFGGYPVTLDSGTTISVPSGITLVVESGSFMPLICPGNLVIVLTLQSPKAVRVEAACYGMEFKVLYFQPFMLPSINYIMFKYISLLAEVVPGQVKFGFSTNFQMATGMSHCETKPEDLDPAEALAMKHPYWESSECIEASIVVKVGQYAIFILVDIQLQAVGAWLQPLGLRNFAIVNPAIALELQISKAKYPVTTPRKIAFGVALYWKYDPTHDWNNWPMALRFKTNGFPPTVEDLELEKHNMMGFNVYALYEQWNPALADRAPSRNRLEHSRRPAARMLLPTLTPSIHAIAQTCPSCRCSVVLYVWSAALCGQTQCSPLFDKAPAYGVRCGRLDDHRGER